MVNPNRFKFIVVAVVAAFIFGALSGFAYTFTYTLRDLRVSASQTYDLDRIFEHYRNLRSLINQYLSLYYLHSVDLPRLNVSVPDIISDLGTRTDTSIPALNTMLSRQISAEPEASAEPYLYVSSLMAAQTAVQILITPQSFVSEATYIVFKGPDGRTYVKNGRTGQIEFSGYDDAAAIQYAIDAGGEGSRIVICGGDYYLKDVIRLRYDRITLEGLKNPFSQQWSNTRLVITMDLLNKYPNGESIITTDGDRFNVVIRNLVIDGYDVYSYMSSLSADFRAIRIGGFYNVVENVFIYYATNSVALHLHPFTSGTKVENIIRNVVIRGSPKYGLVVEGSQSDNFIENVIISDTGWEPIFVKSAGNLIKSLKIYNSPYITEQYGYNTWIQVEIDGGYRTGTLLRIYGKYSQFINFRGITSAASGSGMIWFESGAEGNLIVGAFLWNKAGSGAAFVSESSGENYVVSSVLSGFTSVKGGTYRDKIIIVNTFPYVKRGVATVSGDGTTKDFLLGTHGLSIADPSTVIIRCNPASAGAVSASPLACYLSDENGDGIYESIRVRFATAPPAGTNNVKIVWELELVN